MEGRKERERKEAFVCMNRQGERERLQEGRQGEVGGICLFSSLWWSVPLREGTGPLCHLGYHSLPFSCFLSYPFIELPERDHERLNDVAVFCGRDRTFARGCRRTSY